MNPILSTLSQNVFLMRNVFRAAHALKNKMSPADAYIIILLFEKPLTKKEICELIDRDITTIYHSIRDLTDKGYIAINPDKTCSLTPKGLDLYQQILHLIVGEKPNRT